MGLRHRDVKATTLRFGDGTRAREVQIFVPLRFCRLTEFSIQRCSQTPPSLSRWIRAFALRRASLPIVIGVEQKPGTTETRGLSV